MRRHVRRAPAALSARVVRARRRRRLWAQGEDTGRGVQAFTDAVNAGDGGALFDALDQETRWNWMTIQKFHREAYDIVLSNFPEGAEREREPSASSRPRPRPARASCSRATRRRRCCRCCARWCWPERRSRTARATIARRPGAGDGGRVELERGKNGGWGFAGLAKRAEEDKNRAYHDLEVVRASAADYERAAARAGK